MVDEVISK